jgi:drug/metabolite transporter (DMT)-like permease
MEYMWVLYSLASALMLATSDALTKKALTEENEYSVAWLRIVFSLPVLIAALFIAGKPEPGPDFYRAFFIAMPLEVLAMILYVKALRLSPLSLTLPFLSLTPIFIILFSYIILGEKASLRGGAGILLMAAGGYTLNFHSIGKGLFEPFRAIGKEKGSLLMIVVAVIYSITASFGKMAIMNSSPIFFGSTYWIVITFAVSPFFISGRRKRSLRLKKTELRYTLLAGVCFSIMVVFHMMAMSMSKVAYMIAVKRTSLLIGVLYGYLFFREGYIRERFIGAALMLSGLMLLAGAR